jgi:hypothetical protein
VLTLVTKHLILVSQYSNLKIFMLLHHRLLCSRNYFLDRNLVKLFLERLNGSSVIGALGLEAGDFSLEV